MSTWQERVAHMKFYCKANADTTTPDPEECLKFESHLYDVMWGMCYKLPEQNNKQLFLDMLYPYVVRNIRRLRSSKTGCPCTRCTSHRKYVEEHSDELDTQFERDLRLRYPEEEK